MAADRTLTPEQRSLRARIAAHAMHSKYDSRETSAPARAKFLERFHDEVDPNRELPQAERARRAEHARKSYMAGLALKAAKARRLRAEADALDAEVAEGAGDGDAA